jgi:Animal haem peroxidase
MQNHGSESYYVVGEGLLDETGGGRPRPLSPDVEAKAPPFRFSRMGPSGAGHQIGEKTRQGLAAAMTRAAGATRTSRIPSGFTYLGQFIDHDLTADKTTVAFGGDVSPARMLQGRSPVLDLDSLYGAGPTDEKSAGFYSDGLRLKMGNTVDPAKSDHDLPRVGKGTAVARRKANIPELRNDENLAVAQTHLMFIRFHNRVVDTLPKSTPPGQMFSRARRKVTKHYQWMIRTDFLPRICQRSVVADVFKNGRKVFEVGATPTDMPTMPLEFSVAAYRLGHSMVRAAYNWNVNFPDGEGTLDLLFQFTGTSGNLGAQDHLLGIWIADFRRLYNFGEAGRADLTVTEKEFNRAQRIDTRLVLPLHDLPPGSIGGTPPPPPGLDRNLAYRNLTRARMVSLATGQQMVALMKSKGVTVKPLTKAQIRDGSGAATLETLTKKQLARVVTDTPLWFYILREAELNQGRLAGVGARIVAETFHRVMEGSTFSIVRDPAWRPQLGPDPNTFRMVDLLLFAANGKASVLNPLGG